MEKQIITAERYKVSEEYYVDVREEVAGTGERDYWLCSRRWQLYIEMYVAVATYGGED